MEKSGLPEPYGSAGPEPGNLLHNLLLFGRLLRGLGLDVNPGRMIFLLQALDNIEIGRKTDFYHTTCTLLVHDKDDIPLFDQAFALFWRLPSRKVPILAAPVDKSRSRKSSEKRLSPSFQNPPRRQRTGTNADGGAPFLGKSATYSEHDLLCQKDFSDLTLEELEAIKVLMTQLVWQLGQRRTRRRKPGHGLSIDMRRSLRQNLRYGGEILTWSYRKPKYRARPLVVIADISGSMENYSRLLLHFIYTLTGGLEQSVEAFVFGTRLTRITRQFRERDAEQAMREVSQVVPDWSGGTRIGEALKHFNFHWARRVLRQGAAVLLISDGWDRGDPALLRHEIGRLQRSCHRLIWLNPLLGSPEYEPLTRGMQAALPFIDDFLPVHNLASLEELAEHLVELDRHRPVRRQIPVSGIPG